MKTSLKELINKEIPKSNVVKLHNKLNEMGITHDYDNNKIISMSYKGKSFTSWLTIEYDVNYFIIKGELENDGEVFTRYTFLRNISSIIDLVVTDFMFDVIDELQEHACV